MNHLGEPGDNEELVVISKSVLMKFLNVGFAICILQLEIPIVFNCLLEVLNLRNEKKKQKERQEDLSRFLGIRV